VRACVRASVHFSALVTVRVRSVSGQSINQINQSIKWRPLYRPTADPGAASVLQTRLGGPRKPQSKGPLQYDVYAPTALQSPPIVPLLNSPVSLLPLTTMARHFNILTLALCDRLISLRTQIHWISTGIALAWLLPKWSWDPPFCHYCVLPCFLAAYCMSCRSSMGSTSFHNGPSIRGSQAGRPASPSPPVWSAASLLCPVVA
jgi:hypothetical protein